MPQNDEEAREGLPDCDRLSRQNGTTESGDPNRLLTAREVGEYLGMSASTVLDWWEQRKIPGYRLGGRSVRFRAREIEAWLAECRVEALA